MSLVRPVTERLNLFQQMMGRWESVHPYNAAHIIRLRGSPDFQSLQRAIETGCSAAGVGELAVDYERGELTYHDAQSVSLEQLPDGADLHQVVSEQTNNPFPKGWHHPLRWGLLRAADRRSYFLLATYHHVAADGYAIQTLIADILSRYAGTKPRYPLAVGVPGYDQVMQHHYRRLGYLPTFIETLGQFLRMRRAYRMRESRGMDEGTEFCTYSAPAGLIDALAHACRASRASVNDAFVAALGISIAQIKAPSRRQNRNRIAVGNIVNVRPWAGQDLSRYFGLYLGNLVTLMESCSGGDLRSLLGQVTCQSRAQKQRCYPAGPQWNFMLIKYLWPVMRISNTRRNYLRIYPLSGGLSNINLNRSPLAGNPLILDYCRACPPGPILPFVVAPTTWGSQLNVSVVFRSASLKRERIDALIERFLGELQRFSE